MVSVTKNDVSRDMALLTQSLKDDDRPLVSPLSALKLSMLWPVACVSGYVVALLWIATTYVPEIDAFGTVVTFAQSMQTEIITTSIALLCAVVFGLNIYNLAIVYLSFGSKARQQSIICNGFKKVIKRMAISTIILNWAIALGGCLINPVLIAAGPFMFIMSAIAMQFIVSTEITRYGIGPIMKKLSALVKKI